MFFFDRAVPHSADLPRRAPRRRIACVGMLYDVLGHGNIATARAASVVDGDTYVKLSK